MINRKKEISIRLLTLFAFLSIVFTACKKNSEYYDYENPIKEFDGTALQYLQSQKQTFDSLLVVLDRLPDLKDSLTNQKLTVFAPTNASFQVAIRNLNIVRTNQGKTPLYLKDCAIEQLDTLMCRYMLRGVKSTETYAPFTDGLLYPSLKSNYPMHVEYNKINASGFVAGGPQAVIYSDPKNNVDNRRYWQSSNTNAVNIKAKNAIINVLAPLHDFGFYEFIYRVNQ